MKKFDDVAQGDQGQGGMVTEHLRTPRVGHVTDHVAGNTVEALGTWVTTFIPTLGRLAWVMTSVSVNSPTWFRGGVTRPNYPA